MSFVVFVSKRYLKPIQNLSFASFLTFISILGVAVGVMTLIIVIAIMTGFELNLKSSVMELKPHIVVTKRCGNPMTEYKNIVEQLKPIPGISQTTCFIKTQAIISSKKTTIGTTVKGINCHQKFASNKIEMPFLTKQNYQKLPEIILSTELMEVLGVITGDQVYLTPPKGIITPVGQIAYRKKFYVSNLTNSNYKVQSTYICLEEAQTMLKLGPSVTGIEIKIIDPLNTNYIESEILSRIGNTITVKNWKQMNSSLFSAIKLEKTVTFIILSLVVLIATFSITASLTITVFDKRHEIAILKAMGANIKDINKIFLLKGMLTGTTGIVIGTVLGILISIIIGAYPLIKLPNDIYPTSKLPVQLETSSVILVVLSSLFMCFIATIYPAIKASKTNLIELINQK